VLCAADLLVALDGAVVTVALPAIERDLGASRHDLQWVVTAYTLALGAFLLVGGRAGDLYGRRRVLVAGLLIFALASLAAGLAPATGVLLAARAAQGIGAALAVPAALALLAATFRQGASVSVRSAGSRPRSTSAWSRASWSAASSRPRWAGRGASSSPSPSGSPPAGRRPRASS